MPVTARIIVLMDGSQADAEATALGDRFKQTSSDISDAGKSAASDFSGAFNDATSNAGNFLQRLSSKMENYGLPFSTSVGKMGSALSNATSKASKFSSVMQDIGKVSLIAGAVGLAAVAGESVRLSDQLETAQAGLQTAVTNSGVSWAAYTPHLDEAIAAMQHLGFENTDVETALGTLTTATNSPTKALSMLSLTANLARKQNMSLAESSQLLAKVLGGSARAMTSLGINIDVSSTKLHSIQTAQQSLQTAQQNYQKVQAEMSSGQLVGAEASGELASAQLSVEHATTNLRVAQGSLANELGTLNERTKGAAKTFGATLPGQIDIAKATIHNIGTEFGEYLTGKIHEVELGLSRVIGWFQRNSWAAKVLGGVILTFLGASIAAFVGGKIASLIGGIQAVIARMTGWGASSSAQAVMNQRLSATLAEQDTQFAALGQSLNTTRLYFDELVDTESLAVGQAEAIAQANEALAQSYLLLGESADEAASVISASGEDMVGSADIAAAGVDSALITTGIGAAIVALGLMVMELTSHWESAWHDMLTIAKGIGADIGRGFQVVINSIIGALNWLIQKINDVGQFFGVTVSKIGKIAETIHWGNFGGLTWKSNAPGAISMPALQKLSAVGGSTAGAGNASVPSLGATPGVSGSATGSTQQSEALSLLQSYQSAISSGTVSSLRSVLTTATNEKLQVMIQTLDATHNAALEQLANQLVAAHQAALRALNEALETQQETALADQTTIIADQLSAMTTLLTDRATAKDQVIADKAQTVVDKLGERGLYGLDLVAQQMKVGLDKMTTRWDETIGKDQARVDRVTRQQQRLVDIAQKRVDAAANGSALAQAKAEAQLKEAQAHQSYVVAQANRILAQATANSKTAEAQQQALIAIEEAKAASQFAGTGLTVNITGVQPTDAQAVASAVGWEARTKLKVG